jgi:hypothetical protein
MHLDISRAQITDSLLHPFELAAHWAINKLTLLYLDSLVYLLSASSSPIAPEDELGDKAFWISLQCTFLESELERETQLIIFRQGFIYILKLHREVREVDLPFWGTVG